MAPLIPTDSFILVVKWLLLLPVKKEQRLVIQHPEYGVIVKTVAMVDKNGFIWIRGENDDSISVEQMGPIDKNQVLGRVISIFKPEQQ